MNSSSVHIQETSSVYFRGMIKIFKLLALNLLLSVNCIAQGNVHLIGTMPTVDIGTSISDKWHLETYSFVCILPVEQMRPAFSPTAVMESFGPQNDEGDDGRRFQSLIFGYAELDLSYSLSENWALTGSYTHEWMPSITSTENSPLRYLRNEHRVWLQAKYSFGQRRWSGWIRSRWDQRFIENAPQLVEMDAWLLRPRFRQQFGASIPFASGTLSLSSEFFFEAWRGSGTVGNAGPYRENWSSLQYRREISSALKLEVGPQVVSWKEFNAQIGHRWLHFWYLQATAFVELTLQR